VREKGKIEAEPKQELAKTDSKKSNTETEKPKAKARAKEEVKSVEPP
jgi:hypothetical protein